MGITIQRRIKLFASYIGSCVYVTEENGSERIIMLTSNITSDSCVAIGDIDERHKLIIKPLSEITNEDAMEVAKIYKSDNIPNILATFRLHGHLSIYLNKIESYHYLQSAYYDLPHYLLDGKTFIESGLAIWKI